MKEVVRGVFDRFLAACALAIFSPLLGLIYVAVKISSAGPALYEPEMLGRGGHVFRLKKFRSMVVGAPQLLSSDDKTVVVKKDPRLTCVGPVLRLGFDELPQLFNILCGEMAFVGPRPDPAWVRPRYTSSIQKRLAVRPGITGLAQALDGRSQRQAVIYYVDAFYVQHRSVAMDAAVILLTIPYVLGLRYIGAFFLRRILAHAGDALDRYELLPPGDHPQPDYLVAKGDAADPR